MLFENGFDEALDDVSDSYDLNWDEDSKLRLLARFCAEEGVSLDKFKAFLERQAEEEAGVSADEEDEEEYIDEE